MHPLFHPLYIEYCTYFNGNRDYFECHEVLEEYWKQQAPGDKLHPLVGYVQLATGMYHWRRNNNIGALKILKKAIKNFSMNKSSPYFDFIDFKTLYKNTELVIQAIEKNESFSPFKLTFTNAEFASKVQEQINQLTKLPSEYLLHKHMLRDRSDILEMRRLKQIEKLRLSSNQSKENY